MAKETIYSKSSFDGYTNSYAVEFIILSKTRHRIWIYTNNSDQDKLIDFINSKKTNKVESFEIVDSSTKEHDDWLEEIILGF